MAALPEEAAGCLVAFSGGLDSTVLLHLASRDARPVRAIHIHHGLQADADDWAGHCRAVCEALGIGLTVVRIGPLAPGKGVEDAARQARYAVLAEQLQRGECLLTAHHADDQLETLLLRMMRGTGPDGLAGIPAQRRFGRGWLLRPLLAFPRDRLRQYAQVNQLPWVEDPTNSDLAQDRNYLRHRVASALTDRWPGAVDAVGRLARHSAQQRQVMGMLLAEHRRHWPGPIDGPLPLDALRQSDPMVRPALLRHWLGTGALPSPGAARLERGLEMLLGAGTDRRPALVWGPHQVRRHRGWLYRLPSPLPEVPDPMPVGERGEVPWKGGGQVVIDAALGNGLWIRAMRPGERIAMPRRPVKPVKELLREAGIVPWWRPRLPLLENAGGEVLAVCGVGVTAAGLAAWGRGCIGPVWTPPAAPDGPDWAWLRSPA